MACQRCPTCLTNWPLGKEFIVCPKDDSRTRFMRNEIAIPMDEAKQYLPLTEAEATAFKQALAGWDGTILP